MIEVSYTLIFLNLGLCHSPNQYAHPNLPLERSKKIIAIKDFTLPYSSRSYNAKSLSIYLYLRYIGAPLYFLRHHHQYSLTLILHLYNPCIKSDISDFLLVLSTISAFTPI